ncbi:MAG TPA: ankyrin repeat domain-containing protein [Gemmatimonadaceae bacterium]|nr:ankyrin repeat domain-containing protein [Gemmatimonadaceae bacterium]
MSDPTRTGASESRPFPDDASLEWLRKHAKRRLAEIRRTNLDAKLADAQLAVAREYGFASWRALKAHVDSLSLDGRLFAAAREGDAKSLGELLDAHPELLNVRDKPYAFTLLHAGARHLDVVNLLLERGLDPNAREQGDNTTAMHWAAAAGELDVVRRLADDGGNVNVEGDDHELGVIGWATCWDGAQDDAHRKVAEFLVHRGARHHVFSAIALELDDELRRIVESASAALNQRMSRNENHQLPLHFAVRMNKRGMVALLMDLGADPLGVDGDGFAAPAYAMRGDIDRPVLEAIRRMTANELTSATRGQRRANVHMFDLLAALGLGDFAGAERLWREASVESRNGVLHLASKRGDARAVRWLLDHGADPNALWAHWDSNVTPLHLAVLAGHADVATVLLAAGADSSIKDSKHDSDAVGWAEFFGRADLVQLLSQLKGRSR